MSLKRQQGGSLAIAVFVIVVMSLLAVAIGRISSTSSEQVSYEVLGIRARLAADSAAELMLGQLFHPTAPILDCAVPVSQQWYFTEQGLLNCNAEVERRRVDPDGTSLFYYQIRATGVCKGQLSGDAGTPDDQDKKCLAGDVVCVSRRIEIEARGIE